jgi:phosphohistidine phosphatase
LKRLTLMRHGNAQWKDPQISDFDTPLNRRGTSEAEAMGRRLMELQLVPTILLTSNARRAAQTAEIIARELGVSGRNVRHEESLYLAPAQDILRIIQSTGPRIAHVMIVGHNPGISEAAQLLAPNRGITDMGTASACSFTFDTNSWSDVQARYLRDSLAEAPPVGLFALWA